MKTQVYRIKWIKAPAAKEELELNRNYDLKVTIERVFNNGLVYVHQLPYAIELKNLEKIIISKEDMKKSSPKKEDICIILLPLLTLCINSDNSKELTIGWIKWVFTIKF